MSGIAVITGGTSGIAYGAATELLLSGSFGALVLAYRSDKEGALAAERELKSSDAIVHISLIQGDIAEEKTVEDIFRAVDELETRGLALRAIIHSAGTGSLEAHQQLGDGSIFDPNTATVDFEDYDYIQNVYPKAFIRVVEAGMKRKRDRDAQDTAPGETPSKNLSLSVVAVSSPGCNCTQQVPSTTAYDIRGPVKGTMESLVRYYAKRLASRSQNVTVNCVIPGVVETKAWKHMTPPNMVTSDLVKKLASAHPMGRPGDAREVGAVIAFLCSDKARYVTGVCMPVDGGAHLGYQYKP